MAQGPFQLREGTRFSLWELYGREGPWLAGALGPGSVPVGPTEGPVQGGWAGIGVALGCSLCWTPCATLQLGRDQRRPQQGQRGSC